MPIIFIPGDTAADVLTGDVSHSSPFPRCFFRERGLNRLAELWRQEDPRLAEPQPLLQSLGNDRTQFAVLVVKYDSHLL